MRKNYVFTIYALALAIAFVLCGAFLVGTANVPETYWLAAVKESADGDVDHSYITLDLDRTHTVKGDDGKEKTEDYGVKDIYVYVGKTYSSQEKGKVSIFFDFKTPSGGETSYNERVAAEITEFYGWQKITTNGIKLSRVKIHTPDAFELCEVAFVSETGARIKIKSLVSYSDTTKSSAANVFDEQGAFNLSSAYAYKLSEEEVKELEAADGLFTGGETSGKAPLSTVLNAIAVAIMGRSPFAIRFFSLLSGYVALLALYLLIGRLFASDTAALFGSLFAFFSGALLSGAVTASSACAVPFIILAYYSAVGFYAERYKFSPRSAAVKNLVSCGIFIALAVSFGAHNIIALAGVPVIWGMALYKTHKEYKVAYESAEGLEKETVYLRHNRDVATCVWAMPLAFIVMPMVLLLLFYAITQSQITGTYGGFLSGVISDVGASFGINRSVSAAGLLIGYGSEAVGQSYKLINYLPCVFALVGLVFSTVCLVLSKTKKFGRVWVGIRNKYKLTAVTSAFIYLPLIIGINLSVAGGAAFVSIYSIFIMIGISAAERLFDKKAFCVTVILLVAAFITFIGCCFGVFGVNLGETAAKILYGWQR